MKEQSKFYKVMNSEKTTHILILLLSLVFLFLGIMIGMFVEGNYATKEDAPVPITEHQEEKPIIKGDLL